MERALRPTGIRIFQFLVVAALFVAAAILYPHLPETIPTHWDFRGVANGFSSRAFGTFLLPCLTLLMAVLFPILQRIDPKAENYASFSRSWNILQLCFTIFFAYVFAIQMIASLHPEQSAMVGRAIIFGVGALFVVIGNYMGKIRQNFFIGLRTPWSLSDPVVWQKSQRFGGWAFVLGGIAVMGESLLGLDNPAFFFGVIALVVVVPFVYSYAVFRQKNGGR